MNAFHSPWLPRLFAALAVVAVAIVAQASSADEPGGVSGAVFLDKNGNGHQDAGEPGFAGVAVVLFGHKSDGGSLYIAARTGADGHYAFAGDLVGRGTSFRVTTGGTPLDYAVPTTYTAVRTFFVATDGNDGNRGSREHPFRTIAKAARVLRAGDVAYIRQGEYREYITTINRPIAGGTDWEHPVVVSGMPGERVVIKPPVPDNSELLINLSYARQQYVVFDNLVLDAEDVTLPFKSQSRDGKQAPPCHIRVINCELMHAKGSAMFMVGDDHQFINCRVHDNGHSYKDHGMYIASAHNLIQGCDIYFNFGWGIHLYNGSDGVVCDNVVRGNRVHDNGLDGGKCGIGLHTGSRNLVYDNVLWGNPRGVAIQYGGTVDSVFNNTICTSRDRGIFIEPDDPDRGSVIRNNIVAGGPQPQIRCMSKATVLDHNLTAGDPLFRDAEGLDFHLLPKSPAIDAGATIAEVRTDCDGLPRPQGKAYCQGAYEYSAASYTPTTRSRAELFAAGQKYHIDIGFTKK